MIEIVFWVSIILIFYAYIGYPLILKVITRSTMIEKSRTDADNKPSVSILVPVFNEEKIITQKIKNLVGLKYPQDKIEIIFISDCSDDQTDQIIEKNVSKVVSFYRLDKRQGKAAALNLGLKKAKNEIIVFTDASMILEKNSLLEIVAEFGNPTIGCISGEDHIRDEQGESFYGRYELFLRNQESKLYSIVGASGSFYAQRRELVEPFIEGLHTLCCRAEDNAHNLGEETCEDVCIDTQEPDAVEDVKPIVKDCSEDGHYSSSSCVMWVWHEAQDNGCAGIDYYVVGNVTLDLLSFSFDVCEGLSVIEYYCYYNSTVNETGFEIRNETFNCTEDCLSGACIVPECVEFAVFQNLFKRIQYRQYTDPCGSADIFYREFFHDLFFPGIRHPVERGGGEKLFGLQQELGTGALGSREGTPDRLCG